MVTPAAQRNSVAHLVNHHRMSDGGRVKPSGLPDDGSLLKQTYQSPWPSGANEDIGTRALILIPMAVNDRWSLDFVSDQLNDG